MKVIGIDPGTARTGWAIVEKNGANVILVAYGCITTEKEDHMQLRLVKLYRSFKDLIIQYKPGVVAVEDLFFTTNAKTAISVAQGRGVILLAAGENNIPVVSYSPVTVKQSIAGYGKAEKKQVQSMVVRTLKLKKTPEPDDAADAVAIALTHCFMKKFN